MVCVMKGFKLTTPLLPQRQMLFLIFLIEAKGVVFLLKRRGSRTLRWPFTYREVGQVLIRTPGVADHVQVVACIVDYRIVLDAPAFIGYQRLWRVYSANPI